ncbi:MAG TPA: VRR-NUC domain-containing protein [Chloroflexota bacterium]|nr:VRR-NUC domain-containing protein [Chloroflexota bacterium]
MAKTRTLQTTELEASIVRAILVLQKRYPMLLLRKTSGSKYRRGTPDLLGCYRGRALALECKRPGGKPTPLQAAELAAWWSAGAIAEVVHSADEVIEILKGLDRG